MSTGTVRMISRRNPVTTGSAGWMTRNATIIGGRIWIVCGQWIFCVHEKRWTQNALQWQGAVRVEG